jgi:hypothetical protein
MSASLPRSIPCPRHTLVLSNPCPPQSGHCRLCVTSGCCRTRPPSLLSATTRRGPAILPLHGVIKSLTLPPSPFLFLHATLTTPNTFPPPHPSGGCVLPVESNEIRHPTRIASSATASSPFSVSTQHSTIFLQSVNPSPPPCSMGVAEAARVMSHS